MGVMDAVICFNEGAYARTEVLKALKINPGVNTCEGVFRKIDTSEFVKLRWLFKKLPKKPGQRQIKNSDLEITAR
ncbi:hypothetical protein TNCV_1484581 [Trichonephila clavipes]|nr:hypothetical protein TNCV_1484581 [Trichonephila clavipes]